MAKGFLGKNGLTEVFTYIRDMLSQRFGGMKVIAQGSIVGNTTGTTITLEPESSYLLKLSSWTTSSGAYKAHSLYQITTPAGKTFGSKAVSTTATGSTGGFKVTANSNSTIRISAEKNTYTVKYILLKMM